MDASIDAQIDQLRKLPARALRLKYRELFGESSRSSNRQFLFRRVAWRIQALAQGDLSERARKRALEIANDADLKRRPEKVLFKLPEARNGRDARLPAVGTVLRRGFKEKLVEVTVLDDAFEYQGRRYDSLSAIASEATGSRWNGFAFFGLTGDHRKAS